MRAVLLCADGQTDRQTDKTDLQKDVRTYLTKLIVVFHNFVNALENKTSFIKTDQLMNYVHNSFHDADMTGDTAFLSSENLSLGLSKSAESV